MLNENTRYESQEIKEQTYLCTNNGRLNPAAIGWSKKPVFISNLKGNLFRKKKWNYWCITGPDGMFSVTISDVDYSGLVFAYYLDYTTGEFQEASEMIPFWVDMKMPDHPKAPLEFKNENIHIEFKIPDNGWETRILVDWKNFNGKQLKAEFIVETPANMESLNVVVPWSETLFQYTSKQSCLKARGKFSLSKEDFIYEKEFLDSTYAILDFGRGIWPYKCAWNWGAFSGMTDSGCLGLNVGGKWTDNSGISENSVILNGELFKIQEPVEWIYDTKDFKKPWKIKSIISDVVDLEFEPFFERKAISNLILLYSEVHQCFGRYTGTIRSHGGVHKISGIVGWAEDHIARW